MNKTNLILKYFQKIDQLSVDNKEYQKNLTTLFKWLTDNDQIDNDRSSKHLPNIHSSAVIVSQDNGIIAGLENIGYLLKTNTKLTFSSKLTDRNKIKKGDVIARISGKSHEILAYERTILNILQRMSGIATATDRLIKSLKTPRGWPVSKDSPGVEETESVQYVPYLAATRKTSWMLLDKKAVAIGGGLTHRLNLSDGILIKDNHLAMIKKAFHFKTDEDDIEKPIKSIIGMGNAEAAKTPQGWPANKDSPGVEELKRELIEIEVETEKQAYTTINTYHKLTTHNHLAIMLDNFSPIQAKLLLNDLNRQYDLSQIIFEASGGITEKNIKEWAKTGVDIISLGSLTHSTHAANLSLEICSF